MVEERPGLCCALYNLCCFRETFRISSIRNKKTDPVDFPIVHRFHVRPPAVEEPHTLPGLQTRSSLFSNRPRSLPQPFQPTQHTSQSNLRDNLHHQAEKKTGNRPSPLEDRRVPQKPASRPRTQAHPQIRTKSNSDLEDRIRSLAKNAPKSKPRKLNHPFSAVNRHTGEKNLASDVRSTDGENIREELLATKKPTSEAKLTDLVLETKAPTEESKPLVAEEETSKTIVTSRKTPGTSGGLLRPERLENRKKIVSETEVTDLPTTRTRGGRPGANGRAAKVKRKRLRVPTTNIQRDVVRKTVGQTQNQEEIASRRAQTVVQVPVERVVSRPQRKRINARTQGEALAARSQKTPSARTQTERVTVRSREDQRHTRPQGTNQGQRRRVSQPSEGRQTIRPQVTERKSSRTQGSAERISNNRRVQTDNKAGQISSVVKNVPVQTKEATRLTSGRSLVSNEKLINQPQVTQGKTVSQSKVSGKNTPVQTDAEITSQSAVTDQSQLTVVDNEHFTVDSEVAGQVIVDVEDVTESNSEINDQLETKIEKVTDHLQMADEVTEQSQVPLDIPISDQSSIPTEVPDSVTHSSDTVTENPTDQPPLTVVAEVTDQPTVEQQRQQQSPVQQVDDKPQATSVRRLSTTGGRSRTRGGSRTRDAQVTRSRSSSQITPQETVRTTSRRRSQATRARTSSVHQVQGSPVLSATRKGSTSSRRSRRPRA